MVPCVLFEDDQLLVVNKPAGWNTHAPSPYAGEGIYDWLRAREPRWATLAILHRLDKETSGVLVFGKTPLANQALTAQFAARQVRKEYALLTDRTVPTGARTVTSAIGRVGDKYASRPGGEPAETRFTSLGHHSPAPGPPEFPPGLTLVRAEPLTGRTHQIRVQAAEQGFPIWGDTLYGGHAAPRVCLHAASLAFLHPATRQPVRFDAPPDFADDPRQALRRAMMDPAETDAFRLVHGGADGWPGWFVDRLGDYLLSQAADPLSGARREELARLAAAHGSRGVYHKVLSRQVRGTPAAEAAPRPVAGEAAPERWVIRENGVRYELSFQAGYSVGLFLDQRDNRRRLLTGRVSGAFPPLPAAGARLLNCFAYTCGFSVCAARAGLHTTSLDLSRNYLDWGRRQFTRNGLDPAAHDFIFGDVFDWLRRLGKKGRAFDVVVLDPPTFSQSRETGVFRVEKHFDGLVAAALQVLQPGGVLLASANAADWPPEAFLAAVAAGAAAQGRRIRQQHYAPQPPDFPVSRSDPAYLKTVWSKLD